MSGLPAPIRAAIMMAFCCAFIALSTFFAKALGRGAGGEPMHAFQIVLGRYGFALLALAPFMLASREGFSNAPWRFYFGRAAFGWAGVAGLFAAAAMIPLADATAISFLSPVFSMILAIAFLGEKVGPIRWSAAATALMGGLLLIRPSAEIATGALIALGAALFMSCELVFAKLLARTESVIRTLFITNTLAFALSAAVAAFVWSAPSAAQVGLMAAVGLTMVTAQMFFMSSLRIADASFVTPFLYGTLFFAALYDALWFEVIPAPLSLAGGGLIVAGAVVLAIREGRVMRRPPTPPPPTPPAPHSGPHSG